MSEEEVNQEVEEVNGSQATPYDFRSPSTVPKEQRDTLALLHEGFAQALSTRLSAFLRTDIVVTQEGVQQLGFDEYRSGLVVPTCAAVADLQPLSGFVVFEVQPVILFPCIDRMLGGGGDVQEMSRGLTELEVSVARKIFSLIFSELDEAWSPLIHLRFRTQSLQTNPGFIREIPSQGACIAIQFKIQIGESTGLASFCIPVSNLEPIAGKLRNDAGMGTYGGRQQEEVKVALHKNLHRIKVDVKAVLGQTELSMLELLALQAEDVIKLNNKVSKPLELQVQGVTKFLVRPGLKGRRKAVSIQNEIEKEQRHG